MPLIKAQTLIVAIQAVDRQVRSLRETVAGGPMDEDDHQLLEDWLHAAGDLENTYDVEAKTVLNLPPYREPVCG